MKAKLLCGLLLAVAAGLLVAQPPGPPQVLVNDDGTVLAAHFSVHRKMGQTITWARNTQGQTDWYIRFVGANPCKEQAGEFGGSASNKDMTCTIAVSCSRPAGCPYKYNSGIRKGGPMHDPQIVVDQ